MAVSPQPFWQAGPRAISLADPVFLGILNVTPDSFSDGGRYLDPGQAFGHARELLDQGAGMLDIGAESTRPGAATVDPDEEWARLEPVLDRVRTAYPDLPLSLDTRHAAVAGRAIAMGVSILNDVTGFQDPELLHVALNGGCGLIAMRSRLQDGQLVMPPYGGLGAGSAQEAIEELAAVRDRLLGAGVPPERILLDPGFGFGTTFSEDLALWEALPALPSLLDWPVERFCIAVSRKRFLAWRAGTPALAPLERDPLGARAHKEALRLGYRVVRTHAVTRPQVRAAVEADAPTIAQVQVDSWRATYRGILPQAFLAGLSAEGRSAAFLDAISGRTGARVWVVEARGRLLGFAVAGPCRDEGSDPARTGEVHAIYTLPEAWGQGLGLALMERALAGLAAQGHREAVLWVLERNDRGRRFYESCGWAVVNAPRTVWKDGIALREIQYRRPLDPVDPGL